VVIRSSRGWIALRGEGHLWTVLSGCRRMLDTGMEADYIADRLRRIDAALSMINTQLAEIPKHEELRSRLDDLDTRLARMEDVLYPLELPPPGAAGGSPARVRR
jgi:hypothetical protein